MTLSSPDGAIRVYTAGGCRSRDHGYWQEVGPYNFKVNIFYRPPDSEITGRLYNDCEYLEQKVEQGLCAYEGVVNIEGPETRNINDYMATRPWWRRKKI